MGINNGIWLCQYHAKLIDDELTFTVVVLQEWKHVAEKIAALEARGSAIRKALPFKRIETEAPKLVAEMRKDLLGQPLVRQFILTNNEQIYNDDSDPIFVYHHKDHDSIESIIITMQNDGAVLIYYLNNVIHYKFTEEFVSYLVGDIGK